MCVIMIGNANKILPHAEKAMDANPHGSGVAWLDSRKGKKIVRFVKGIYTDEDAKDILTQLKDRQCVFHARIATAGGNVPALTHPFPVEINPDLSLTGESDLVLFQNGHVIGWEKLRGERFDTLNWSDSRAIAHGMAIGKVKDLTDPSVRGSRFVLFAPDFLGYYPKRDWSHIKGGVLASNRDFLNPITSGWQYGYGYEWENPGYPDVYEPVYKPSVTDHSYYRAKRLARYGTWGGHGTSADYKRQNIERDKLRADVRAALTPSDIEAKRDELMRSGVSAWEWPKELLHPTLSCDYEKNGTRALIQRSLDLNPLDEDGDVDDITASYLNGGIKSSDLIGEEDSDVMELSDSISDEPPPDYHNFDIRYDCSGQVMEEE